MNGSTVAIGAGAYWRIATSSDSAATYSSARYATVPSTPAAIGSTIDGWKRPASAARRQLVGERLRLLGRDVEAERLHRDQSIALRLIGAEDRSQRADADLVQHPEGAELRGCRER